MSFALFFPGQGSQSVGMLDAWLEDFAVVRDTLAEAADTIGVDLPALVRAGPLEELNATANTQPAMLAADIALWRVWQELGGPQPALAAGHSLGEFAALVAAQVLTFADAVRLVRQRGQWMQQAVPAGEGAMAAVIGMQPDDLASYCASVAQGEVLEAVNFNAPGQIVVSGHSGAVDRLVAGAKSAGARLAQRLPLSVPAHSSLMAPVADSLRDALGAIEISAPVFSVLHNIDATPRDAAADIRDALARQVCAPVQWVATMDAVRSHGEISLVGECGPGSVLCGLGKRGAKGVGFHALGSGPEAMQGLIDELNGARE